MEEFWTLLDKGGGEGGGGQFENWTIFLDVIYVLSLMMISFMIKPIRCLFA